MTEEVVTTIEGPKGNAEIVEIMRPAGGSVVEIEYAVLFQGQRTGFGSLGEAHVHANQLTGADDEE